MISKRIQRRGFARGFSIVEATLAVGTAATVIVVLVGLIPASLDQMTDAAKTTAEARIVQAVVGHYQMRPWQDILEQQEKGIAGNYFFDAQGTEVPQDAPEQHFTVRTTVSDMEKLPGSPVVNDRMRQVQVWITDRHDSKEAFQHPGQYRRHSTAVSQTDKR